MRRVPICARMVPHRKKHRLPAIEYQRIGSVWSLTLAVKRRQKVFAIPEVATAAFDALITLADAKETPLLAACIMPDHVHIIVSPSLRCSVLTFVARFKQLTWWQARARGHRRSYWQRSFWDRGVRHQNQLEREVNYVMRNPVRGGLAPTNLDYPYSFAPWLEAARRRRDARESEIRARLGHA
jgi:REP element-mobilizing transposase RayT